MSDPLCRSAWQSIYFYVPPLEIVDFEKAVPKWSSKCKFQSSYFQLLWGLQKAAKFLEEDHNALGEYLRVTPQGASLYQGILDYFFFQENLLQIYTKSLGLFLVFLF